MMSVATGGTPIGLGGIVNVWFGAKGSTIMAWPPKVTSATSVAPRTPLQVASDSARTNEAVTAAALPGSTDRSARDASLLATPFAPLVMVDISVALRTPGIETVSSWLVCKPPLGGSSPVSERVSGPTTRPRRLTLTKAPKARPLYVTPAVVVEVPAVMVARSGGPPPGLSDGGAGQAGEPQATPKMSSTQASENRTPC